MGVIIDSVIIVYDGSCIVNQKNQINTETCVLIMMLTLKKSNKSDTTFDIYIIVQNSEYQ